MPILLSVVGIVLVIAGLRNRITGGGPSLVSLLKQDFTGSNPFWKWAAAIFLIGAIGYIDELKPISRAFMVLVIIVFLFSNQGVFAKLQAVFTSTPTAAGKATTTVAGNAITNILYPKGNTQ